MRHSLHAHTLPCSRLAPADLMPAACTRLEHSTKSSSLTAQDLCAGRGANKAQFQACFSMSGVGLELPCYPRYPLWTTVFAPYSAMVDTAWLWPAEDSWLRSWPRSAPAWALTRQLGQWSPCWWLQAAFRTGLKLPFPRPTLPTVPLTSYPR